uniref:Uncharacterized protein n=1 Tax=Octopus bimaculoides TaxID=37653 RepID=A0A0L8G9D1_OCTBM
MAIHVFSFLYFLVGAVCDSLFFIFSQSTTPPLCRWLRFPLWFHTLLLVLVECCPLVLVLLCVVSSFVFSSNSPSCCFSLGLHSDLMWPFKPQLKHLGCLPSTKTISLSSPMLMISAISSKGIALSNFPLSQLWPEGWLFFSSRPMMIAATKQVASTSGGMLLIPTSTCVMQILM